MNLNDLNKQDYQEVCEFITKHYLGLFKKAKTSYFTFFENASQEMMEFIFSNEKLILDILICSNLDKEDLNRTFGKDGKTLYHFAADFSSLGVKNFLSEKGSDEYLMKK